MGIFGKVMAIFGGGRGGSSEISKKSFLVDGARLLDEKTGRKMSPREQLALLGALGRMAKQEGFTVEALFESDRPLREAEEGGVYQGVTVHYAETSEALVETALRLAKKSGATLVTSGPNLESKATEARVPLLSCSTFRKAFLQGFTLKDGGEGRRRDGGNGNGNGGQGGGRRGHDRRRGRGRGRGGNGGGQGGGVPAEGGAAEAAAPAGEGGGEAPAAAPSDGGNGGGGDAPASVRNLIDLVE